MSRLRLYPIFVVALVAAALVPAHGQAPPSTITVHVHKSGLFSGFAHNHEIKAPVAEAHLDARALTATIVVETRQMRVMDPDASEKDRKEIQATMLGPKVLDTEKFPQIRFQSSRIEQTSPHHFRVTGTLELHGVRREISLEVVGGPERYQGKTKLKQTNFGIQPVSIAGGTIKVKDEIELEFDIYSR